MLTDKHVVVETGGCFDDNKVYSLNTVYGIYDAKSGDVTDKVKSISGSHGDVPVSDQVTCETVTLQEGKSLSGIVVYSDNTSITKVLVLYDSELY